MKKVLFSFLSLSLVCLFACSKDYVKICKDIYEDINNLPCIKTNELFDVDAMCPESYNENDYDYDKFFECLKKSRFCKDDVFVDNVADCVVKK